MKTPSILLCVAAVVASTMVKVDARPMHAGIDYHRYLQEKDDIQAELDDWMAQFKDQAAENGWIPAPESRSADETDEDHRQRFFLTKENIKKLEKENPDATFSTNSPFTLLTDDEFSAYVGKAYRRGDEARRLRGGNWWDVEDEPAAAPTPSKKASNYQYRDGSRVNARTPSAAASRSYGYDFSSFFDWIASRTKAPSTAPSTRAPTATRVPATAAPVAPATDVPAATRAPVSAAPVATRAPATAAPATSSPASGPVAPKDSELPAASATAEPQVASDGDSLDWSKSACISPVQNQGQCGSCWAFATVAAIESAQCIANGKTGLTKYSEQQLTSCDTSNMGCNGGAPTLAYRYIQTNGLCTAATYPYASSGGSRGNCQSSCAKVQTGLKGSTRVSGEAGLIAAVQKKPVVVAVAAGNNAWKQYSGGVLSTCQTSQVDHAVVAVGYDASTLKIRNSWGARWGEAGYIRLKRGAAGTGTCSMYTDMSSPNF